VDEIETAASTEDDTRRLARPPPLAPSGDVEGG
jgi:hypothetical protein